MLGLLLEWLRNWQLLKKGSAPWGNEIRIISYVTSCYSLEEAMNEGKDIRIISVCSPSVVVKVTLTNDMYHKQLHGFVPCETKSSKPICTWHGKIDLDIIFFCCGRLRAIHMNLSGIIFNCQHFEWLPRLIIVYFHPSIFSAAQGNIFSAIDEINTPCWPQHSSDNTYMTYLLIILYEIRYCLFMKYYHFIINRWINRCIERVVINKSIFLCILTCFVVKYWIMIITKRIKYLKHCSQYKKLILRY
jgi:hypothetical protein